MLMGLQRSQLFATGVGLFSAIRPNFGNVMADFQMCSAAPEDLSSGAGCFGSQGNLVLEVYRTIL
jgi:hypothetical protein